MAGIVELFQTDNEPIYVNPVRVTRMTRGTGEKNSTIIYFDGPTNVIVNGDLDEVAFKLFPDSAR